MRSINKQNQSVLGNKPRPLQLWRKFFHVFNGSLGLWFYAYSGLSEWQALTILACFAFGSLGFDVIRMRSPNINAWFTVRFSFMMRREEEHKITSITWGLLCAWIMLVIFPRPVDILLILFVTYGDTIAGIIGPLFGKHKINAHASIEGSLALFFLSALMTYFSFEHFHFDYEWSTIKIIIFSLCAGLIAVVAEGAFPNLDDNATIPLVAAPLLWILFQVCSL